VRGGGDGCKKFQMEGPETMGMRLCGGGNGAGETEGFEVNFYNVGIAIGNG